MILGLTARSVVALAVVLPALSVTPAPLRGQATFPDSARLLRVVAALAHDSMAGRQLGSEGGAKARALLVRELQERAIEPLGREYVQPFPVQLRSGAARAGGNVLGVIRGTSIPERYIVVSAHYDHLGMRAGAIYNGADDNASGTAAALEVASWLRAHPPLHSVIIALFDGEEAGMRGARAFFDASPVADGSIILDINLDMVGRNDRSELYVAGTSHYPELLPVVEAAQRRSSLMLRTGHDTGGGRDDWTGASDHAAFHERGIPFLYLGEEDHADYHRPTDDAERMQPGFFAAATRTIIDVVRLADEQLARAPR